MLAILVTSFSAVSPLNSYHPIIFTQIPHHQVQSPVQVYYAFLHFRNMKNNNEKITYLVTQWSSVLLEKQTGFSTSQEIPRILWNPKILYRIHKYCHLSISWASSIHSVPPQPTSWRSILILSSHLHLGLPSDLFPSGFPTKTLYTSLISPIYTSLLSY